MSKETTSLADGVWIECEQDPENRLQTWQRRVCWLPDGRVFVPVGVWMNETAAMLCASHDAESVVMDSGHVYLSSEWLAREFPEDGEDIRAIAEAVRQTVTEQKD